LTEPNRFVVALGAEAARAAAAFAEAGAGVASVARRVAEIDPHKTTVVFALESRVDIALIERLFPPDPALRSVPGLVFARDSVGLERRARSIARQSRRRHTGPFFEIHPYGTFGEINLGTRRIVGANAPAEALRAALTAPTDVLTISTHSNGYDLLLGDHFALCTALNDDADRDLASAPSCRMSGACHRLKLPMAEVLASGRLIPPEALEARILLLFTCLGMVPTGSAVDPGWNYGGALLGNPSLAAMVTSWTLFMPTFETIERLLRAVYSGRSLGEAVAAYNATPGASRLAVLGDPDVTTSPLAPEEVANVRYVWPKRRPGGDGGRFLAAMLYRAAMHEEKERVELAIEASEKMRLFEHLGLIGLSPSDESEIGRVTRDAVITYLAACGNLIFEHWIPFAEAQKLTHQPCGQCDTEAELFRFTLRDDGLPERVLALCPRCGIRADRPADSALSLSIANGAARLHGARPRRDWRAVLHLGCQDRRLSTTHPWPADPDGTMAGTMRLPDIRPPGSLIGSIILLDDNAVSVLSAPIPPAGTKAVSLPNVWPAPILAQNSI
jgi:hypothetical protein